MVNFLIQELKDCNEKIDKLEKRCRIEKINLTRSIIHYKGRIKQISRILDYYLDSTNAGRL